MIFSKKTILYPIFLAIVVVIVEIPFVFGLFHTWQEKIMDRLFLNKSQSEKIVVIAIDDTSLKSIGQWPWSRATFSGVLENLISDDQSKPKSIGIDVSFSEPSRVNENDDLILSQTFEKYKSQKIPVVLPIDVDSKNNLVSEPISVLKNFTSQGFIDLPLDGDAVVRRTDSERGNYKSFSSLLANESSPKEFRIDYRGLNGFLTVPFADVLNNKIPNRIFKDKIVLIGATAPNLHDFATTPFNQMPGVTVNANAIETILNKTFFSELPIIFSSILIGLLALCVCLFVRRFKRLWHLTLSLFVLFAILIVITSVAFGFYLLLPFFYFAFAFLFALISALAFEYITESKQKTFIRKSFQYYLTPQVIEQLLENPEKLSLGGESRRMTILFSDIRGFTTISESLTPEELTQLLNDYLTTMTDIIMDRRGVVDKYIGDAVMAFWNAPLDNDSQEIDACESAIAMIKSLREFNKDRGTPLAIGIGINTGNVVVGNMGSNRRFNYTVMGDEVNLASRLESLTKYYRVNILVTESVVNALSKAPHICWRELDEIIVKGKNESKKVFEILVDEADDVKKEVIKLFESGRVAYSKGDWSVAGENFKKAIELNNDGPSQLFLERCEKFKIDPPENWNGVYHFDSK